MADLTVTLAGLTMPHPIMPGPFAGLPISGGAAVVLPTVTLSAAPPFADVRRAAHGKDGVMHRAPSRPFDPGALTGEVAAARGAGRPVIGAVGYGPEAVATLGAAMALAGVDAVLYDTHHARRDEILPALQALRHAAPGVPVIVHLGPHHGEDLADLAVSLEPWADAFCVIGSFGPVLSIDAEAPGTSYGMGFLSGAPIRPVAQRFLFELARRTSKPLIAAGGIATGRDVAAALMLGASAVMVTTAAVAGGPGTCDRIAGELDQWLDRRGFAGAADIQGAYLQRWRHGQRVVTEKEEAPDLAPEACIKCTFCETVCFYDAIKAPAKALPTLTAEPCFQCGLCVSACPTGALFFRPRDTVTRLPGGITP